MSNLVEIRGLAKSYQSGGEEIRVLRDLSLQLKRGTMLAVTGESGSGKSTFLHLLGGMEKPDRGSIRFMQKDITRMDGQQLASFRNREIGFVFQFHHLLPEFSALENVMFPLLLRRQSAARAKTRAQRLLREVSLENRAHHRPGELSGGEQQRVAIARALAGEPRLLLGDEPTGNLDLRTALDIQELLLELHQQHGLTSILVTHNLTLAAICHQHRELVGGQLVEPV